MATKPKRGRGRPKKYEGDKVSTSLTIRVTPGELSELKEHAVNCHRRPAEWGRLILLEALKQKVRP